MPVDLNALPLEAPDMVQPDFDNYQDAQEFPPPPPEGTYSFRTTKAEIEKFENGVLTVLYDHELFDMASGNKIGDLRFDRVSTKVFKRNEVPVSMAADQLRAIGVAERPSSPRQWGEQLLNVKSFCDAGNMWQGAIKWDGYCGHKGTEHETKMENGKLVGGKEAFTVKGMKKFPQEGAANGSGPHYADTMPCPTCKQEVRARAKVDRRIPKA